MSTTRSQIRQMLFDTYLDGSRDAILALIDGFEAVDRHDAAEVAREALFVVEARREKRL